MFKNGFAPIEFEKVGRVIRRRLLFLLFLLLLTFNMLVVLNLKTIGVSAVDSPYIAVVPSNITDISLTPGESFNVSIYTNYDGNDINGWQLTLSYNPHILHGIAVTNGDLITKDKHSSAQFKAGDFNNTAGKLGDTTAFFRFIPPNQAPLTSGPGILANVTFGVVGLGDSSITIGDETKLYGYTEGGFGEKYDIIYASTDRDHIQHGYFCNTAEPPIHDVAVLSVTPNDTLVIKGELVDIDVVVENQGTVIETFDVSLYYEFNSFIGKITGVTLNGGENTSLTYTWDTTAASAATLDLRAVASIVWGETDTEDNTLILPDIVTVLAPPQASFTYSPSEPIAGKTVTFNAATSDDLDGSIVSYEWNFGDDTNATLADPVVTHKYTALGIYTVNLTVTDDDDLTDTATDNIPVLAHNIAVRSATASSIAVRVGNPVAINVTVANKGNFTETFNVTVYANTTEIGTQNVIDLVAGTQTIRTFSWNTTSANLGTYTITANITIQYTDTWTGDNVTKSFITTEKPVVPDSEEVYVNQTIMTKPANYTIEYEKGNITFTSAPEDGLEVKAICFSPEDYDPADNSFVDGTVIVGEINIMDHPVVVGGRAFHVVTESNSTVSNFEFIQADKKISFNVTGPDGTVGYCNVTIPNLLLGGPYTVLVDNLDVTPTDPPTNGTHTFLYFTYPHSTKEVQIEGSTVATPPKALFTPSTTSARIGETITFDASESNDPDGTIDSYTWDFGDDASDSGEVVTHAYSAEGNYTVTLTVTDNQKLTNTDTQQVTIEKLSSTITISASPTTLLTGETTTISGSITPLRPRVNVTIWYWPEGQETWKTILKEATTDDNSQYSYVWTPLMSGIYELRATWEGDETAFNATSNVITIEVNASPLLSPYIGVVPYSTVNPDMTVGTTYTVSIYTDYDGSDIMAYQFTLSYNPDVLHGGINNTDTWIGDGTTTFSTTGTPVVPGSEAIYVNEALMTVENAGYDIWTGDNETKRWNLTGKLVVPDSDIVYVNETLLTRYTAANDTWTGDGVTTMFNTTHTPLVQETEPIPGHGVMVRVNGALQKEYLDYTVDYHKGIIDFFTAPGFGADINATYRYGHYIVYYAYADKPYTDYPEGEIKFFTAPADGVEIEVAYIYYQYVINYEEGEITFTLAPSVGAEIKAIYLYGGLANGDLIVGGTAEFIPGDFDNTAGTLSPTAGLFFYIFPPPSVTSGPGILANVTFTVVGTGASNIILGDQTKLTGWNSTIDDIYNIVDAETIPNHIQHGYFDNTKAIHDVAVISIEAPAETAVGDIVSINVTITNQGSFPETVNVIAYANTTEIGKQLVTLPSQHLDYISFKWNTSGFNPGTYTLRAEAILDGDSNPINNLYSKSIVVKLTLGIIEGTVTDSSTGDPIEGATVTANGYSNITDAGGHYSIEVPPGTYNVTASATKYVSQSETATVTSNTKTTLDFALTPLKGTISGTVTDSSTGDPIAGATVTINGISVSTGTDGTYSIEVPPGTYNVTVSADGYEDSSNTDITVVSEETTPVDFELTPTQSLNILLYAGVAAIAIIVVAAIAVYFLKVRKPT